MPEKVLIFCGSSSDEPHYKKLQSELDKLGIPNQVRICSAHKQPGQLEAILNQYNQEEGPFVIVGCAGGTDALSGTASFHSVWPVVSCPPDGMNQTCLTNPPGSSNAFIQKPGNVAKFCAQCFSMVNPKYKQALIAANKTKVEDLQKADAALQG